MKTIILIISLCCCFCLQAGQVRITGETSTHIHGASGITINTEINGKTYRLCKKKRMKPGKTYTLRCSAPDQVDYITIASTGKEDKKDFWSVKCFTIELPNGERWQFVDCSACVYINGLTFYFTGEHAGELHNGKHGEKTKLWCKGKKIN
jgi:hypothetical protein